MADLANRKVCSPVRSVTLLAQAYDRISLQDPDKAVDSLQITFAVRGSEFTPLPWLVYEAVKLQGADLFASAAEVDCTLKIVLSCDMKQMLIENS